MRFVIEHQCPQCGAPALLEETDRLFRCEFCRVRSYLAEPGYFRYLLPHNAPAGKDLFYFPYWRFKGMQFTCFEDQIQHRFTDVSYQAISSRYFPMSVGLRSQALKLKFVSPEAEGMFLRPQHPFDETMDRFQQRSGKKPAQKPLHHCHIGESLSLLYAPFYLDSTVHDAVLNQAVSSPLPQDFNLDAWQGGKPAWRIGFIPTLCPHCGWDMEGRRDTLVLLCRNCDSVWKASGRSFKKIKFAYLETTPPGDITYLPFWSVRTAIDGLTLHSYADLIRIANLPRAVQPPDETRTFRFWTPAFKITPKMFIRLANNLTLIQPRDKVIPKLPQGDLFPVTLPITEAVESLKITLAEFVKPRRSLLPRLNDIHVNPKGIALIYIPFAHQHHELVHPDYQVAVNKNMLAFSDNL